MTDRALMDQIMRDPEEGIRNAIREYGPLVKAVIIKILGNENGTDVQECISEVFARLWKYGEHFTEQKGTLKSYMITIARNEALRKLKSIQISNAQEMLEEFDLGIEIDMTHEVAKKMNKKIVHQTIESLKEPDRQIFIRRYFWGERIKTIASALHLEEKFVENRIYLVKKKLKDDLLERGIIL